MAQAKYTFHRTVIAVGEYTRIASGWVADRGTPTERVEQTRESLGWKIETEDHTTFIVPNKPDISIGDVLEISIRKAAK